MGKYIAGRMLQLLPTLLFVTVAIFLLLRLIPGDPALVILGPNATPERVREIRTVLGLEKPLWQQYLYFMQDLIRGNMGQSIFFDRSVGELVAQRFPVTLFLVVYSTFLMLLGSIPLAIAAAAGKDRLIDYLVRFGTTVSLVLPAFWLGLLLMSFFSLRLRLLPVSGYGEGFGEHLRHLFLPALTIALGNGALVVKDLRASLLETLRAEHVRTAQAKGLTGRLIFLRHVLRNSMISTVSLIGLILAFTISSTVIVETVFNVPGIGWLMVNAIFTRDYPVVQGVTLVFALFVLLLNLLTDLVYSLLDPRVVYR